MSLDPLTLTYDRLAKILEDGGFKLINWNSSRDPEPDVHQEASLPEWQLRPTVLDVQLGNVSCGTTVSQTYTLLLETGDDRVGELLFPTSWQMLKTLYLLKYGGGLESLEYNGHTFVNNTELVSVQTDLDLAAARGIEGWSAIWDINVQMHFPSSDLEIEL